MSKAKVRSMQRGAQKRSEEAPIRMQEIYKNHPPRLANGDKPHLDFRKFGKPEQLDKIRTVILAAQQNGIDTASEVSCLLNKLLIKTAIGDSWTPRLAWFAAKVVKSDARASQRSTTPTARSSKKDVHFRDLVNRVVKSRLEEIKDNFAASQPTLGDASPELLELKRTLEQKR
ncbi:MAG: hypothetical protein ACR2O2_18095 [Ruegeria sp.]